MAHLVRPHIVRYVHPDGKHVPKGTPGARKVRERSSKWYAGGLGEAWHQAAEQARSLGMLSRGSPSRSATLKAVW